MGNGTTEKLTRTYDAVTNAWRYTATGRRFYRTAQISFVVKVPATFTGTRSNGTPYTRNGHFPLENPIQLRATLTEAQRDTRIRQEVARQYPDGVLSEVSEERVTVRAGGAWFVAEMITTPGAGPNPNTNIVRRGLGAEFAAPRAFAVREASCRH